MEAGILEALYNHRVCATFAVIPFRMVAGQRIALSVSRAHPLIEAEHVGVIEVAQHGYTHARLQPEPALPSEFLGRPPDQQRALIIEGHDHLASVFGHRIQGFVPPFNSYDAATLSVLESEGFSYVSAGWNASETYRGPLKLLPMTTHLSDLPAALQEARRFVRANPVVVTVMHHYDFAESGSDRAVIDLAGFSAILAKLTGQSDITLCRLGDVAVNFGATDRPMRQRRLWTRYRRLRRILPKHHFFDAPLWRGMLAGALKL